MSIGEIALDKELAAENKKSQKSSQNANEPPLWFREHTKELKFDEDEFIDKNVNNQDSYFNKIFSQTLSNFQPVCKDFCHFWHFSGPP